MKMVRLSLLCGFVCNTLLCFSELPHAMVAQKRGGECPGGVCGPKVAAHPHLNRGESQQIPDEFFETEDRDRVLAKKAKAVILLGSQEDVGSVDAKDVEGVVVKNLTVPGDVDALKKQIEDVFSGRPLTLNLILEIKRAIIKHYVSSNEPLILVEIPEQDVTGGVIQFVIHKGKLGEIVFRGNEYFTSEELLRYINLERGREIDYDVLMSNVEWLNRNPFHHTTLYLTPGIFPGTTNVELDTTDRRPILFYVGADNTGNRFTGFERNYAGLTATKFFKLNHIINYQYTESNHWDRFQASVLNYSIPLPWRHILLLVAGFERTKPKIEDFSAKSKSFRSQLQYIIPLNPTFKKMFHEVTVQLDFQDDLYQLEFVSGSTSEPIRNTRAVKTDVALGYNGRYDFYPHNFLVSAVVFASPGTCLPHQSTKTYRELRPFANHIYGFADFYFEYNYALPFDMGISQRLKGQRSSTNLIFDTYTIGDYYSVRGYEDYFNRDNALIYNFEFLTPSKKFGKKNSNYFRGLTFFDYGIGSNHTLVEGEKRSLYVTSAGPGLRVSFDPYGWIRLDWGIRFQRIPFSPQHGQFVQFGAFLNY
jgi:hemolysin activation/secretion protein